jgi:hypothetical protein
MSKVKNHFLLFLLGCLVVSILFACSNTEQTSEGLNDAAEKVNEVLAE